MKHIANYISISRALMSIMLAITETFSIAFYIIYIYCGISDMIDGIIARKSKNESKIINADSIIFEIIICCIATFAAVQEGHYIRTKNLLDKSV